MKSTWFGDRSRYEFAKLLHEADYGRQHYDSFRSFLLMATIELKQASRLMVGLEKDPKMEADYIAEAKRYKHPQKFCEAFAVMVEALSDHPHDFLGQTMSELEINDKAYKGQCFTPSSLCSLMAKMSVGDYGPPVDGRTFMLNEPACGGGAMIIATSTELQGIGYFPWHYFWVAVDVDQKCFHMTYIQMFLLGIPGDVIWGNSLTLEQWDVVRTYAGILHPPKKRKPDDPQPEPVTVCQDQAITQFTVQRELF